MVEARGRQKPGGIKFQNRKQTAAGGETVIRKQLFALVPLLLLWLQKDRIFSVVDVHELPTTNLLLKRATIIRHATGSVRVFTALRTRDMRITCNNNMFIRITIHWRGDDKGSERRRDGREYVINGCVVTRTRNGETSMRVRSSGELSARARIAAVAVADESRK